MILRYFQSCSISFIDTLLPYLPILRNDYFFRDVNNNNNNNNRIINTREQDAFFMQ
jgi:hypothetical protein